LFGGIVGLGGFTFVYAKGYSYLADEAAACANCHIMRDVYDAWNRSSHKAVAVCNDCHVPHDSVISKYAVKAIDGFKHSAAFTLDNFHEPIRITGMNYDTACASRRANGAHRPRNSRNPTCLRCHANVGHEP
jgi:cytochrome c nitrite reductase small subunit